MQKPGLPHDAVDHDAVARLLRVLAQHSPERAAIARDRWEIATGKFRVTIAGRPWSGKSTIAELLTRDGLTVDDRAPDCALYVLPGSLREVDRTAIAALDDPVVVLNKADAISPDPERIAEVTAAISAELGTPVVPLTAHVASGEADDEQIAALRSLAEAVDVGAQVAGVVFTDSPVRSWGPPAVAVAVSAIRLDATIDRLGITRIVHAFSGVARLRAALGDRMSATSARRCRGFLEVLEACTGEPAVRDDVERFLAGPVGGGLALRAALWSGESVADLRERASVGSPGQRRDAIRAERALVRRMQSA